MKIKTTPWTDAKLSRSKAITQAKENKSEVVAVSSTILSDIACDIGGAISVLNDIGQVMLLIKDGGLTDQQISSVARLSSDASERWITLLNNQLDIVSKPLAESTPESEKSL